MSSTSASSWPSALDTTSSAVASAADRLTFASAFASGSLFCFQDRQRGVLVRRHALRVGRRRAVVVRDRAQALPVDYVAARRVREVDGEHLLRGERAASYEEARRRLEQAALDELATADRDLLQELLGGFAGERAETYLRRIAQDPAAPDIVCFPHTTDEVFDAAYAFGIESILAGVRSPANPASRS